MNKPTICVDFDGVLNNYKGYDGVNLGTPRKGAKEFLRKLSQDYTVRIFSVRKYTDVIVWLNNNGMLDFVDDVTSFKVPAVAYIDDRAVNFDGDYDKTLEQVKDFKPYWKS